MGNKLKYSGNEFVSQTKGSNEKAVKLIIYHDSRLKVYLAKYPEDEDYTIIYERTHPIAALAQKKLDEIINIKGIQIGQTETVNLEMESIKGKKGFARDWYNRTAAVYARNNPGRMTAIWSQGLKPFNGEKDTVVSALNALSMSIGDDENPQMIKIKAEVDKEYNIINPDRTKQMEDMGATELMYKDLDTICYNAMVMEYRNSGRLMEKFPENENNIQESFHDMELLLSKQQTKWNITLAPLEVKDIATRTMLASSKLRASNTGGNARIYLASFPGGINSNPVDLIDGIDNKFTAADFGVTDYGVNRYITVVSQATGSTNFKLFLD